MGKSVVRVSREHMAKTLFPALDLGGYVIINGATLAEDGTIALSIEGPAVPDAPECMAICYAHEPLTISFKPRETT